MYLMYIYRGHLKIRKGTINEYGNFIPEDNPKTYMTEMPFDYYLDNKYRPYMPHTVCDKYMFGKVLFENEEDIPKWKNFFKELYSNKIKGSPYKKQMWANLVSELEE